MTGIFSDDFDADTTGANKTTFASGSQLVEGSVSVFGPGYNNNFPGHGNYLQVGTASRRSDGHPRKLACTRSCLRAMAC
jgi:hypothetical protein